MHPNPPELRWSPRSADALAVLAEQVGGTVGRLCGICGSSDHGRPWARTAAGEVPVSVSRAGELLVTAVGTPGFGLGVDVELIARDWPLAEMLAAGESVAGPAEAARLWVRKEAVLKATGTGLTRPMTALVLADFDGTWWEPPAPDGYVVAAASVRQ